ncbi:MAG: response regulator [Leadbetterella sp.]|nr:response regulator [Leadbetterella sp.]
METKLEIVRELSLLYELSLSIGGSLDLKKTSEDFLKVWMRQKNIDFGSIWIENKHLDLENPNQFSLIFAHPHFLVIDQTETLPDDFAETLMQQKAIQVCTEDTNFQYFKKEKNIKSGSYWFLEIPNLGFIKFFFYEKNPSQKSFNLRETKKTEKVLGKLSIALQSCLLHNKVITETEQKNKYQKEIKKLALVAEKTDNAIVITDSKGHIEWANDGFMRISGYSIEEAIGKKPGSMLQGPETNQETVAYIRNQIKEEKSFRAELLNYSKTGKKYWIEFSIQPIYDDNGLLINFIAVESDITDRKNKEVELNEAKEKAEESGRIKQEFLSVVSHEIRTPLNGIIGMSNLLQKTQLSPQQSDYLNTIQISSENLSLIINSILDFSKIESGLLNIQVIPFNLKKILQNIINSNEFKAEQKGLGLFLKLDPKIDSHLIGDGIRLSQVLLNLISNAIKFTISGKIELEIRLVSKMNNALVLEFIVEDTGKGIPDKMQKIIFESFTQEDSSLGRKYGGTGLGLSISQKLVSLMGGELKLTSQENVGTKVSFILGFPINQEPTSLPENSTVSDSVLIGKKILLVEDNTMNQFFAQKLLEGWGIKVDIANNGKEGVEMFGRKHYDCILMDIQMPEMDGIQATKIIRQVNKYIPIIALTALSVEEEADNFKSAGMNDFITKPFEAEYLKKKLIEYMLFFQSYSISSPKSKQTKTVQTYNNSLLTQMMKGNQVQIRQMEQLFVNQAEEVIKQMHQYFLLENWKEIGLLAHKLKASIDMLQITNLKQEIRKLESIEKNKTEKRVVDELIKNVTETLRNVCLLIKNSHK